MDSKKTWAQILVLTFAAAAAYAIASRSSYVRENLTKRDSIAYWAAGKLLIDRDNPYDAARVLEVQRQQGYSESKPLVLRTPPWSLFLVLPLGLMSALAAWLFWVATSLAGLIIAIRLSWRMYGFEARAPGIFLVICYLFAPVPACLVAGQMGLLLLLGIVLFLWWKPVHPLLAGVALILPFAKPHLLSLFWVVLVLWIVREKRWWLAAGFLLALLATTAIALVFDPAVFQHYHTLLREAAIGHEFIPAFSGVIRLIFLRRVFWVQFVPMIIGLVWSCRFYWKNTASWDWREHGPALLVVSVLTTPYAWLTDEVILLPAILQAAVWVYTRRDTLSFASKFAVSVFAALNLLLLLILNAKVPFSTGIYFWSSLVWFGWYFYAGRVRRRTIEQSV
jgi:hypothetical protein